MKRIRCQQPRIGVRKLQYLLSQIDIIIGRDNLFTLLRAHGLLVQPKRTYHKTTQSHHRFHCHPNLLKIDAELDKSTHPEQIWVADITYLPFQTGHGYLSLITDKYSRKIVGYQVDDNMMAISVAKAYQMALKKRRLTSSLIHHSDRGLQYCSKVYQQLHQRYGVICSMTDGYDCYQNGLAERVNGILKTELLLNKPYDLTEAKQLVKEAINIYNTKRPHCALGYRTPDEVHRALI